MGLGWLRQDTVRLDVAARGASAAEPRQLLDAGLISVGVAIPDDFDRRVIAPAIDPRNRCWHDAAGSAGPRRIHGGGADFGDPAL